MSDHRPEHTPKGDPCSCGIPASSHRSRRRKRGTYFREYHAKGKGKRARGPRTIIAIDGEGYTTKDGRHLYTYLAACTASELVSELVRPEGVDAKDVFEWLCELPSHSLIVGYSLGYDVTKWIESLPDRVIFALNHPERRPGKFGPRPVKLADWHCNRISTRFSVKRVEDGRSRTVWDVWRFFNSSFVKALRTWAVGTPEAVDAIERMKQKRGSFRGITSEEQAYCRSECRLLAQLAAKLVEAHDQSGLSLTSFYGPGSTAAKMLTAMGAEEQCVKVAPAMAPAVACAFFGGRFECSLAGPVKGRVWSYDIASAYPYAMTRLPCLAHMKWTYVEGPRAVERALARRHATALVSYALPPTRESKLAAWGPLPVRTPRGDILFPTSGPGGWAWEPEYLAATRFAPNVVPLAAWIGKTRCACGFPFAKGIAAYYAQRLAWGKDGRGMTVKGGINSCYGKRAQRVGSGQFRCLVSAGLITATARGMLLDAIASCPDPWDVLSVATDSVMARRPLTLPKPWETGTERAAERACKLPLGAWEEKTYPNGIFLIRPGLRFALGKTDVKETAARGLGIKSLHENRRRVQEAWARRPMGSLTIQQPSFFHGCKVSVREVAEEEYVRSPLYGRWTEPEPRKVAFDARPKREGFLLREDGNARLLPWELPMVDEARSRAYGSTGASELAKMRAAGDDLAEEQPEYAPSALGGL